MNRSAPTFFTCEYQNTNAALERILRVIRVRGFQLQHLQLDARNALCVAQLAVSGERPVGLLMRQLEKLVDVKSVQMLEAATGAVA